MNSKTMAVIAIVVVVIIGGVAAFLLLGQSGPKNPTDIVCTEPEVGDSIEICTDLAMTSTESISEYNFLVAEVYPDLSEMKHTGDKTVTFKDVEYECGVYLSDGLLGTERVVVKESGFMLEMTSLGVPSVLKDTNMDPMKKIYEISLGVGDYMVKSSKLGEIEIQYILAIDGYDEASDTFSCNTTVGIETVLKEEIASIEGDVITTTDGNTMTKTEFLAYVDYDMMIAKYEESGYTISFGQKHSDTIDTPFGKRDVTVQAISICIDDDVKELEVYYGVNGAIYMTLLSEDDTDASIKLISTTLFTTVEE